MLGQTPEKVDRERSVGFGNGSAVCQLWKMLGLEGDGRVEETMFQVWIEVQVPRESSNESGTKDDLFTNDDFWEYLVTKSIIL